MTPRRSLIVLLEVLTVVFTTLATFMPMKAILMLASDTVPGFFPSAFVTAGPLVTAVVLIAVSAALGLSSGLTRKLAAHARVVQAVTSHSGASLAPDDLQRVTRARFMAEDRAVEVVIVLLFGTLLAAISVPFLLGTIAWLAIAYAWVSGRLRFSVRDAATAHHQGNPRARYLRLIRSSVLPSSIVISLLVLLVSEPRLGVTGALLSVVVGRRFQLAAATLLPRGVPTGNERQQDTSPGSPRRRQGQPRVVAQLLPTRDGTRLDQYLGTRGIRLDECEIVGGGAHQNVLTLVSTGSTSTYWRVFTREAWHMRALELSFRESPAPVSLFEGESVRSIDVGSLALLEISCPSEIMAGEPLTRRSFHRWHSRLSQRCAASVDFQHWADDKESPFPEAELSELLALAATVPGAHQWDLAAAQSLMASANDLLCNRPYCWIPMMGSPWSGMVQRSSGHASVSSPMGWAIGRVGDPLARGQGSERGASDTSLEGSDLPVGLAALALQRARLMTELRRTAYGEAAAAARRLAEVHAECVSSAVGDTSQPPRAPGQSFDCPEDAVDVPDSAHRAKRVAPSPSASHVRPGSEA